MPLNLIKIFDEGELELLMCGIGQYTLILLFILQEEFTDFKNLSNCTIKEYGIHCDLELGMVVICHVSM